MEQMEEGKREESCGHPPCIEYIYNIKLHLVGGVSKIEKTDKPIKINQNQSCHGPKPIVRAWRSFHTSSPKV